MQTHASLVRMHAQVPLTVFIRFPYTFLSSPQLEVIELISCPLAKDQSWEGLLGFLGPREDASKHAGEDLTMQVRN